MIINTNDLFEENFFRIIEVYAGRAIDLRRLFSEHFSGET